MSAPFDRALFDPLAIKKCLHCITEAEVAIRKCLASPPYDEFWGHWRTFLLNCGGFLNALEAGAKVTPQGRQWYGRIKSEMRDDELLSYMFQARNAEEHNKTGTAKPSSTTFEFKGDATINLDYGTAFILDDEGVTINPNLKIYDGENVSITSHKGEAIFKDIVDEKHGNTFKVPTKHKGILIKGYLPAFAGRLYLEYLKDKFAEVYD